MVNPTCEKLGSTPSMIRELFAYGLRRSASWIRCGGRV